MGLGGVGGWGLGGGGSGIHSAIQGGKGSEGGVRVFCWTHLVGQSLWRTRCG